MITLFLLVHSAPAAPSDDAGAVAEAPAVFAADRDQIRGLIDDQIAAFREADAEAAWRVVAPGLQSKFGTAEHFLRMVKQGYRPMVAPRSYSFEQLVPLPTGELGQWLEVVGADGERVRALYLLESQSDGSWRTSGCMLFAPDPPLIGV